MDTPRSFLRALLNAGKSIIIEKENVPQGHRKRKGETMSPFSFNHFNFNVLDLERSMKFYEEALDLHELSRNERDDFIIVFLGDDSTDFRLELTYMRIEQSPMISGSRSTTSHFARRISGQPMHFTKRWAVSALKITVWAFILLKIRTATGLKSFRTERSRLLGSRRREERGFTASE